MIKQFIPKDYCLRCKGCCRFKEEDSVWAPCLLDVEMQELVDKKDIPAVSISADKRIHPVFNSEEDSYLCPFFNPGNHRCRIYEFRPFECQLYPFLLNLREARRAVLTVDLNCPYVKEKIGNAEFKAYTDYLTAFLNSPKQIKLLRENPHLVQAYEDVAEIIELNIS